MTIKCIVAVFWKGSITIFKTDQTPFFLIQQWKSVNKMKNSCFFHPYQV